MKRDQRMLEASAPVVLVVSIVNRCNMNCPQCAYPALGKRPLEELSIEHLGELAREAGAIGVKIIRLMGLSEASLHSSFSEVLETLFVQRPRLHLLTNGTALLGDRQREGMVRWPPAVTEIGLDAATPGSYREVRGGGEGWFRKIERATEEYAAEIRQGRQKGKWRGFWPELEVSFVRHQATETELEQFRLRWEGLVDRIRIREPHSFNGRADFGKLARPAPEGCGFIEKKLFVEASGEIHACTLDFEREFVLGDVGGPSALLRAWRSEARMNLLREHAQQHSLPPQCLKCEKCPDL